MALPDSASVPVEGRLVMSGASSSVVWQIATEVPVALMFNSASHAVMMATPADLEDFAVGFTLSEGLAPLEAIKGVIAFPGEAGWTADVALSIEVPVRRRAMEGRSGCGLCGVEEIAHVLRPTGKVERRFALEPDSVLKAFAALPDHQPMNAASHSVHGAAWVSSAGDVLLVREDVGRHNALDKLIGALARRGENFGSGFVAMTSRCSFELVQKAASLGVPYLVSLSAPTSLALSLAREAGVGLAARARGGLVLFD
jgi:FdhD protein